MSDRTVKIDIKSTQSGSGIADAQRGLAALGNESGKLTPQLRGSAGAAGALAGALGQGQGGVASVARLAGGALGALAQGPIGLLTFAFGGLFLVMERGKKKAQEWEEQIKKAGTAGATAAKKLAEANDLKLEGAVKEIERVYSITRKAADAAEALVSARSKLATAETQAALAQIDLDEAKDLSRVPEGDDIARRRVALRYAEKRQNAQLDASERAAREELASAQAGVGAAQATADRDAAIRDAAAKELASREAAAGSARKAATASRGRRVKTIGGFEVTEGAAPADVQASLAAQAKALEEALPALRAAAESVAATARASAAMVAPEQVKVAAAERSLQTVGTQRTTAGVRLGTEQGKITEDVRRLEKGKADAEAAEQAKKAAKAAREAELERQISEINAGDEQMLDRDTRMRREAGEARSFASGVRPGLTWQGGRLVKRDAAEASAARLEQEASEFGAALSAHLERSATELARLRTQLENSRMGH